MIIFYDLTSSLEPKLTWDHRSWTARLMLNYTGIPYATRWIDYPEIEPTYKQYGLQQPTHGGQGNADGSEQYTLPVIYDEETDVAVAGCFDIARYLDERSSIISSNPGSTTPSRLTGPNATRSKFIPDGTDTLQAAFADATFQALKPGILLLLPLVVTILHPESQRHYLKERCMLYYGGEMDSEEGMLAELSGEKSLEMWRVFREGLERVDGWFRRNEVGSMSMSASSESESESIRDSGCSEDGDGSGGIQVVPQFVMGRWYRSIGILRSWEQPPKGACTAATLMQSARLGSSSPP